MVAAAEMSFTDLVDDRPETFQVHTDAYMDAGVFDAEMRRIFERTWVYVGHESQVPAVGDYRTTAIGRQPVIVSRHEDGEIYVLLNRCRHRGSVVCRDEVGHSRSVVPAIEMIRSGRHPLDLLSTHRFPLERTHEALDLAGRRTNPSAIHVSVLPAPNGAMR